MLWGVLGMPLHASFEAFLEYASNDFPFINNLSVFTSAYFSRASFRPSEAF
jgi:hypothetical protein